VDLRLADDDRVLGRHVEVVLRQRRSTEDIKPFVRGVRDGRFDQWREAHVEWEICGTVKESSKWFGLITLLTCADSKVRTMILEVTGGAAFAHGRLVNIVCGALRHRIIRVHFSSFKKKITGIREL
jgi:hypothetical protein